VNVAWPIVGLGGIAFAFAAFSLVAGALAGGFFGVVEMLLFIGTVFIAYAYVWRRGGLEWE